MPAIPAAAPSEPQEAVLFRQLRRGSILQAENQSLWLTASPAELSDTPVKWIGSRISSGIQPAS